MDGRAGVLGGAKVGQSQTNIYSVVFTEEAGKLGFEMFLLRGEMRRPEQIAEDLHKAREWVSGGGFTPSR